MDQATERCGTPISVSRRQTWLKMERNKERRFSLQTRQTFRYHALFSYVRHLHSLLTFLKGMPYRHVYTRINVVTNASTSCKKMVNISKIVFTARRLAKRGICRRRVSVRLCVCMCVSVTLRYCIKTAKRRITQITPHDSPLTLVF